MDPLKQMEWAIVHLREKNFLRVLMVIDKHLAFKTVEW